MALNQFPAQAVPMQANMPQAPVAPTTSLDLPPALQGLLGLPPAPELAINERAITPMMAPDQINPGAPTFDIFAQANYAQGGMVGPTGAPDMTGRPAGITPQGTTAAPMSPQMVEQQIQDAMRKNPQGIQQLQQVIMTGIQSGEIDLQELNMAGQLAMTALQSPDLYPQLRQFAIQQGMATEQDLSPTYDQGLVIALVVAVRAAQQMMQQMGIGGSMGTVPQVPPMGAQGMQQQNFAGGGYVTPGDHAAEGGKVVGPGTGTSDSIPIKVSAGEYVIPAHVVKMKGKEFFDSMLEKYKDA